MPGKGGKRREWGETVQLKVCIYYRFTLEFSRFLIIISIHWFWDNIFFPFSFFLIKHRHLFLLFSLFRNFDYRPPSFSQKESAHKFCKSINTLQFFLQKIYISSCFCCITFKCVTVKSISWNFVLPSSADSSLSSFHGVYFLPLL